jgi:4-alpha-glucanotransferase
MVAGVWMSPARLAVAPVQDLLGLDATARMNTPGSVEGNWRWRLKPGALGAELAGRLRELTEGSGRR